MSRGQIILIQFYLRSLTSVGQMFTAYTFFFFGVIFFNGPICLSIIKINNLLKR
jgi:hypothetical protein